MLIRGGPTLWRLEETVAEDGGPLHVAVCQSPRAIVCGRTERELLEALGEALELTFGHLASHGLLESFVAREGLTLEPFPARVEHSPINGVTSVLRPVVAHT